MIKIFLTVNYRENVLLINASEKAFSVYSMLILFKVILEIY